MPTKKEIQQKQNTNLPLEEAPAKAKRRIDYNREILDILSAFVESFPDQRFGQIICNYFLPEYREKDPFFEESKDTLERLNKMRVQ